MDVINGVSEFYAEFIDLTENTQEIIFVVFTSLVTIIGTFGEKIIFFQGFELE